MSAGSGAISGCTEAGGICSGTYDEGTEVTLDRDPGSSPAAQRLERLHGGVGRRMRRDGRGGGERHRDLRPDRPRLTVTKSGDGSGTVTSTPAGIDCGTLCASGFEEGTTVTLTAVADSGSEFTGWSGACTGVGPCLVTLDGDQAVVAGFAKKASEGRRRKRQRAAVRTCRRRAERPRPPRRRAERPRLRPTAPLAKPVKKKPLQCKRGFRKLKQKGKRPLREGEAEAQGRQGEAEAPLRRGRLARGDAAFAAPRRDGRQRRDWDSNPGDA